MAERGDSSLHYEAYVIVLLGWFPILKQCLDSQASSPSPPYKVHANRERWAKISGIENSTAADALLI